MSFVCILFLVLISFEPRKPYEVPLEGSRDWVKKKKNKKKKQQKKTKDLVLYLNFLFDVWLLFLVVATMKPLKNHAMVPDLYHCFQPTITFL